MVHPAHPVEHRVEPGRGAAKGELPPQSTDAQKMEVVGQLAGGIAHDFSNLLAVILGQTGFLLNESLTPRQQKRVEAIHRAGERAVVMTRRLLTLSRREVVVARVFDLSALIVDLATMLRRLIREDIDLVTHLGAEVATIRADPGQIEQVILNLAVNARDAMPHGGTLTVETAVPATSERVLLTMTDTGSGMTEAVKAHLFEPFFTTKPPGQGTGLGLATVRSIIERSGASIACESAEGLGATFTISFPRVRAAMTSVGDPWVYGDLPQGTETILLVEDDDDIREITHEVLMGQGHTVLDAPSAGAALQRSRSHSGPVHLLLADIVMPAMGGQKLAEQLLATRPTMKVLYMSGHTDDVIVHSGVLRGDLAFLAKPFTPLQLARKVREVLDATGRISAATDS